MKKTLKTKVEVTANVTFESDGKMELKPFYDEEIFEQEASFRARVKRDRKGITLVTPVHEGTNGSRYVVLLDTSCGCVKATQEKVIVQLAFPKRLGNRTICELLKDDIREISSFLRFAVLEDDQPMRA